MSHTGLRALLHGDGVSTFLSEYFPDRVFLAEGSVARLAGLVDYDFDALVEMKKGDTMAHSLTVDGDRVRVRVEPGQERALYDCGFTIYFHGLVSPAIGHWVAAVEADLGLVHGVSRVSAFASRRGLGLSAHYDHNDNFVCQARGAKRFRVAPNAHVTYPTVGYRLHGPTSPVHRLEAPGGFPAEFPAEHRVVDMRPGSVMFLPRGTWHDVETIDDESLHFNIQARPPTWKDMVGYLLAHHDGPDAARLRAPALRPFKDGTLRPAVANELKEALRRALEGLTEDSIEIEEQSFYRYLRVGTGAPERP